MEFKFHHCPYFFYLTAFIALSLTACATSTSSNPHEQYKAVLEADTLVALDDMQAITNAVVLNLQPKQPFKTAITTGDPKLQLNTVQSNYKIFALQGRKHFLYTIELRSLCDCWGLDKLILYPVARILDKYGNITNNIPANISLSDPDWNYPVSIRMAWEGTFEESGPYYFLVSAYNDNVGATYITYTEFDYLASQIEKAPLVTTYLELLNSVGHPSEEVRDPSSHPLWSSPTGRIVVVLTIKPEGKGL